MEHMLKPAGPEGVTKALMPLMLTQQLENLDNLPEHFDPAVYLQAKSKEYERHLQHFPLDILTAACDAHVKESAFFPAVAHLVKHAGPALGHRERQARRLGLLIQNQGRKVEPVFVPEAYETKMLASIATYRRLNRIADAERLKRYFVREAERAIEKAAMARTLPPVWAIVLSLVARVSAYVVGLMGAEAPTPALAEPMTASTPRDPLKGTLPRDDRKWERASDAAPKPWQAGAPVYQQPHEEPPPPDEIPEGDAP